MGGPFILILVETPDVTVYSLRLNRFSGTLSVQAFSVLNETRTAAALWPHAEFSVSVYKKR